MGLPDELLALATRNQTGISFAEFMRVALYHPAEGYYSRPRPIGRQGDFFTSVSVGACFGFLLARQIREVQAALEPVSPQFDVVEQGAHDGRLSADLLDHAGPGPVWRHRVVEPNPRFREVQAGRLGARVEVVSSFAEVAPIHGVYLCNELLDAFPVRRLRFELGNWRELRVIAEHGILVWAAFDLAPGESSAWPWLPESPEEGFETEVCPGIDPWLDELTTAMDSGVAFVIDYGGSARELSLPERAAGSVRGFREHQSVKDPLEQPGETDLTADVNFTHVWLAAQARGWQLLGFADQAQFLTGIAAALSDPESFPPALRRQFQTLVHPGIMGRRFRVLGLAKNLPALRLSGFRFSGPEALTGRSAP